MPRVGRSLHQHQGACRLFLLHALRVTELGATEVLVERRGEVRAGARDIAFAKHAVQIEHAEGELGGANAASGHGFEARTGGGEVAAELFAIGGEQLVVAARERALRGARRAQCEQGKLLSDLRVVGIGSQRPVRASASPLMISSSVTSSGCAAAAAGAFCFAAGGLAGLADLGELACAGLVVCVLALRGSAPAASTATMASPSDSDRQDAGESLRTASR